MIETDDLAYRAAERAARASYGKLVAMLAARNRDIAAAEDALSEALVSALRAWPVSGVPANPDAWLLTAARNRQKNEVRARQLRQEAEPELVRNLDLEEPENATRDRRLDLMFVCAHPAINTSARTALILQSVLGLDAVRIARAFLVEHAAMSQRLVRAKARIRDAGLRFALPEAADLPDRLEAVLEAVYAAFGEGWDTLDRPEAPGSLSGEAIWLARLLVVLMPEEPEPKGLLALMLYCSARRNARRDEAGRFVPLDRQDARLWDRDRIIEAERLLTAAARCGRFGRFQCEAAIQSIHIQRPITGQLNYKALRTLYDLLVAQADSIGARIGRAVVIAEADDPLAALAELDSLPVSRVEGHQPFWVARSRIARLSGQQSVADEALQRAIALTTNESVKKFLLEQYSTDR